MDTEPTSIDAVLASFDEPWAPRVLATVNDYSLKIARMAGDYVWHAHAETDELFIVLSGALELHERAADGARVVHLGPQDVHVVRRGVEHRPCAPREAVVLMVEPSATLSTGDFAGAVPAHITSTRGLVAPTT